MPEVVLTLLLAHKDTTRYHLNMLSQGKHAALYYCVKYTLKWHNKPSSYMPNNYYDLLVGSLVTEPISDVYTMELCVRIQTEYVHT